MNWYGLLLGIATLFIIGLEHSALNKIEPSHLFLSRNPYQFIVMLFSINYNLSKSIHQRCCLMDSIGSGNLF